MYYNTNNAPSVSSFDIEMSDLDRLRYIAFSGEGESALIRVRVPDPTVNRKRSHTVRVAHHESVEEALRHAINYRDWCLNDIHGGDKLQEVLAQEARPVVVKGNHKDSKTGMVGVRYSAQQHVFRACWVEKIGGKSKSKMRQFSIKKLSLKRAWGYACAARDEGIGNKPKNETEYFKLLNPEIISAY